MQTPSRRQPNSSALKERDISLPTCERCHQRIPPGKEMALLPEKGTRGAGQQTPAAVSGFVHRDPADCKQARILWLLVWGAIFFLVAWAGRAVSAIVNLPIDIRATVDYIVVYAFGLA